MSWLLASGLQRDSGGIHGRHRAGSAGGAGAPGRSAWAAQCHPISVPSPSDPEL